jgi:hypothetical protein
MGNTLIEPSSKGCELRLFQITDDPRANFDKALARRACHHVFWNLPRRQASENRVGGANGGCLSYSPARLEDASGILGCLAQAFAAYRVSYTPAAFADTVLTRRTLRERFKEMTVLVAIDQCRRQMRSELGWRAFQSSRP